MTTQDHYQTGMGECCGARNIKLTFFNAKSLAEPIRLAFAIGNVSFEDKRVEMDDFSKNMRDKIPYGQLPILEVDDEMFTQSSAILRFAGKLSGLYPSHDITRAMRIDATVDIVTDINRLMETTLLIEDQSKKMSERKRLTDEGGAVHRLMKSLSECVGKHGRNGFSVGPSLTIADLAIHRLVDALEDETWDGVARNYAEWFPTLVKVYSLVRLHPAVRNWNTKHNMRKLTFVHFKGHSRCDMVRLALAYAGIDYEDQAVGMDEFKKMRHELPYGQLPILKDDHCVLAQSSAIARYVGKMTGTYPTLETHAALVDEIIGAVRDDLEEQLWKSSMMPDEEKRESRARMMEPDSRFMELIGDLEARYKQYSPEYGCFLLGKDCPSLADFSVYSLMETIKSGRFDGIDKNVFDKYNNLSGIHKAIGALDATKGFMKILGKVGLVNA